MRNPVRTIALIMLCLLSATASRAAEPDADRSTAAYKAAHKSNVEIYIYRRAYTPDENVSVRVSAYNAKRVALAAYPISLPSLVPDSKTFTKFEKRIKAYDLIHARPTRRWAATIAKPYPDQWNEQESKAPKLAPGIYLIQAIAGGIEKRTWLAVTDIALVSKRSRQALVVYAARPNSGAPVAGLQLTAIDERGTRSTGTTGPDGIWRASTDHAKGSLWIYGTQNGQDAFGLAALPDAPDLHAVYLQTDRPLYRPGQVVDYKGTVRRRVEADTRGGFLYPAYANKPVQVEIRDSADALIAQKTVTTNAYGSFSDTIRLAAEPPLGRWQIVAKIGDDSVYSGFDVQAYRKPEYSVSVAFDKPHYLGGDSVPVTISAKYYFGSPVAATPVQYAINFAAQNGDQAEDAYNGQGVTDAMGQLHLDIRTRRLTNNRTLSVSATVTDLSRRPQQGASDTLITAGTFQLSIDTDKNVYHPGEPVAATVTATDYDSKTVPSASVKVALIETKYDAKHRQYQETTTRTVKTGKDGRGTVSFKPLRPGDLQLQATAFDADDNKIQTQGSIWVTGDDSGDYDYPTLNLIADRTDYKPGETATLLINSSLIAPSSSRPAVKDPKKPQTKTYPEAWALVTIEGERLYRQETIRLTSRSTVIHVPLTLAEFPSAMVNVAVVQEKHIYEQNLQLSVENDHQKLTVQITPNKPAFRPGDQATYTITTHDYQGRPVPAEVTLGIVDASLYALEADAAPDINGFFYAAQDVRIATDFSFAAQYSGGAMQAVAAQKEMPATPPPPGGVRVRRNFADTAYWNPSILTDASGSASVSFTLPDNLTTWRATARGMTQATQVGASTQDTISTMPLLVRLETPRFYITGDEGVVSAIVHNDTPTQRSVAVTLDSAGLTVLSGSASQTLTIAANAQQRVDWRIQVTQPGGARLTVTADGGDADARDATETTVPVQQAGLEVVTGQAPVLTGSRPSYSLDLTILPPNATVTVTLAPSLAGTLRAACDDLESRPDGSAEEIMSEILPEIVASRAGRSLPGLVPDARTKTNIALGIQTLYRYQHQDGGWNWWEFDQTDGDQTAYVLCGLEEARDAGFLVDDQRLKRGAQALLQLLDQEKDLSRQADWLAALSDSGLPPDQLDAKGKLSGLFGKREKLDPHGQASLLLALARAKDGRAASVAQELLASAKTVGTTVFWPAEQDGYTWRNDDSDVTAHVLRALLAARVSSPKIFAIVRWLLANRDGAAWDSAKTSSESILAIAAYLETNSERQPSETARILLDGQPVKTISFDQQNLDAPPVAQTLTATDLSGHKTLSIEMQGTGIVYVTETTRAVLPPAQATPQTHGITVHRTYRVSAEDPSQAGILPTGRIIDVTDDITADANYQYAVIRDPLPSGCEVDSSDDDASTGYDRRDVLDDAVVFSFDSLPKGVTSVSHRLRTETPGRYQIEPSIASLAYFPEIRGNSGLVRTEIVEPTATTEAGK